MTNSMNADHIMPFPEHCDRAPICVQSARIAVVESRVDVFKEALERIEQKVDGIRNWLLGAVFSTSLALIAIIVALLRK